MAKEINLEEELEKSYRDWDSTRETGCSDPFYDDSVNLNLLRNHIIYWKQELYKKYGEDRSKYPGSYFKELPPEVNKGFMVRAAEIRDKAAESLAVYLSDANFKFLLCHKDALDKKEAECVSIENVLGYVSSLAYAIKQDDLITMRRHAFRPESYQESFARCAEQVKKIVEEKSVEQPKVADGETAGQMNLFQFGVEMGKCR